jgi:hypothetical protein
MVSYAIHVIQSLCTLLPLRNVARSLIDVAMGVALHAARALTREQAGRGANDSPTLRIHVVSPLEPSERSGGSKAVKGLLELLSPRMPTTLIHLPTIATSLTGTRANVASWLLNGLPAQLTSTRTLFLWPHH